MSEQAVRQRGNRQSWAARGSSQDRWVVFAGVALPAAILALAATMVFAPLGSANDVSFLVAKNNVAVAHERLRITDAMYRGQDEQGRAFQVSAQSAVQATSRDPVVQLGGLAAELAMAPGTATVSAAHGRYDMTTDQIAIDGPMQLHRPDGYQMTASDVTVDMRTRKLQSRGPVAGRLPIGSFSAAHLQADLGQRSVVLEGHAHLHIEQGKSRGWTP